MIIFESNLTTFEASFIFWGSWGSIKNWLELKIKPPLADLALLNPWNTLQDVIIIYSFRRKAKICDTNFDFKLFSSVVEQDTINVNEKYFLPELSDATQAKPTYLKNSCEKKEKKSEIENKHLFHQFST